jgi:hypothetical protein
LAAAHPATRFVQADYGEPNWSQGLRRRAPFDAIVSGFSIHHQPDCRKRRLYAELFDLLAQGGLFLNLEHVSSASPWVEAAHDAHFVEALWRFVQAHGHRRSRAAVQRDDQDRPDKAANRLAPVETQCQWLRELGFAHVDCFFKTFELALFGGMKPPSRRARARTGPRRGERRHPSRRWAYGLPGWRA